MTNAEKALWTYNQIQKRKRIREKARKDADEVTIQSCMRTINKKAVNYKRSH